MADDLNAVVTEQSQTQAETPSVTLQETPAKNRRTRTDYGITQEEFVNTWNELNGDPQATADRLTQLSRERGKLTAEQSVPKNVVAARLSVLRKKGGITLKETVRKNRASSAPAATPAPAPEPAAAQA